MNDYHDKTKPQLIEEIKSLKNRIGELEQSKLKYKQAEKTINTNEIKLRNIIEHSSNLFYSHTPDHLITYLSPQTREFFDCGPEEAKIRWTDFLTENPCNEIGIVSTGKAIETGKIQPSYELEAVGKKGRKLWIEVNEAPVVEGGQTIAIVGALTDITERKRAEEALIESKQMLSDVLNTIPVRVFWKDLDGVYLGCNQLFAKDAGRSNPEELIGDNDYNMGWAEQAELYRSDDKLVIESGRPKINYEEPQTTPEGKTIWLNTSKIPLWNSTGDAYGVLGTYEDITERKNAEEALLRSEAMFKGIFSQAPVGIELYDPEGSLINANQECLNVFGVRSVEDVKGFKLFENPNISEEAKIKLRNGLPIDYESEFDFEAVKKLKLYKSAKSGKCFLQVQVTPYQISDSGDRGFVTHVQDITERKRAEQALRDSEYLLRESQKVAQLGHYGFDVLTGNWTSSEILDDILGIDDNFNKTAEGWSEILHPDSREEMLTYFNESVINQHQKYDKENKIIRISDGEECWIHGLGELEFDSDGNPVKMIGTIQDITKQKRSEEALQKSKERYSSLYQKTPAMLHSIDQEGCLTNVSKYWLKKMGYSLNEVLGRHSTDFMTEESSRYAKEVILPKFYETGSCRDVPYQYVKKNGEVMDALLTAITENDENGELIDSLSVIIDVTDRKQAEEALKKSETKFRTLFETMAQGVVYGDVNGKIISANPAAEKMLGLTIAQMQGLSSMDPRWKAIREDGSDFPGDTHPSMIALETGKRVSNVIMRVFNPSLKKYRWLNIHAIPEFKLGENKPHQVYTTFEDITVRKLAEDAFKDQSYRNQQILDTTLDGYILADSDGNMVDVNPAYCDMIGYSWEELLKMNIREVEVNIPPDEVDRRIKQMVRTGGDRFETKHKHKNGHILELDTSTSIMYLDETPLVAAFVRDITKRKEAENALKMSEDQLRLTTTQVPAVLWTTDTDLRFTSSTGAGLKVLGLKTDQVVGMTMSEYLQIDDPENLVVKAHHQALKGRLATYEFEWRGRVFDSYVKSLQNQEGKTIGIIGFSLDITERKMAEDTLRENQRQLATLMSNLPGMAYKCKNDPDWTMEFISDGCYSLTGYPSEELINSAGVTYAELIHPEDRDTVWNNVQDAVEKKRPFQLTYRIKAASGVEKWVWEKGQAIFGADGDVISLEGFITDITERKAMEKRLRESHNRLRGFAERLQMIREEERATIAREIHDDLGQSLTALKMDISWVKNNPEIDAEAKTAKFDTMLDLTNSTIQTVKRIATELRPGILDDLGLVPAIEWQAAEFQVRFKIKCNVSINKSDIIIKDEISIAVFRIFQETLTNIARHSSAAKVDVNLNFYDDDKLIMEITDNGIGIDEEQINSSKSLGLFGMRERVNILKGKIEIIGEHGKGTKVRVSIPVSKEDVGSNK
jgi:PAS domain S-box-containing protein